MAKNEVVINAVLNAEDRKVYKSLQFISETMRELAEELPYRDEIKKCHKAAKYVMRNISLSIDDAGFDTLMATGEYEIVDDEAKDV